MKKLCLLLICLLMVATLALSSCGLTSAKNNIMQEEGAIGDYYVKIGDAAFGKNDDNENCIIITYTFTNNSGSAKSFMWAITDKAYQNGVECESAYSVSGVDTSKQSAEIKKGASIDIQVAYILNDITAKVEIELTKFITLSSNPLKVVKKFDIPAEITPTSNIMQEEGAIGDYYVKIGNAAFGKDYNNKKCIIVTYTFTNNADSAKSFMWAITDKAYQNGVECKSAYSVSGVDTSTQSTEIKKGASIDIKVAYVLNDSTSQVEIELTKYLSLSSKPLTVVKTFDVQ